MKRVLLILLPLLGCEKESAHDERIRLLQEWYDYIDVPVKNNKYIYAKSTLNEKLVELVNRKDSEGNYLYKMPTMWWVEDNVGSSGQLTYYRDGSGKATLTGPSGSASEDGNWYIVWNSRACEDNSKAEIHFYIDHDYQFSKKIGLSNIDKSRLENAFEDTSLIREIYSLGNSTCESFMERNNLMIGAFDTFDECKADGSYLERLYQWEGMSYGSVSVEFSEKLNHWKYPIWNTLIDTVEYTIKDCERVDYTVFHQATSNNLAPTADEYWVLTFHRDNPGDKRKFDLSNIGESTRHSGQDCKGHKFKYLDGKKDGIWGDDEVYKNGSKVDFGLSTYSNVYTNYDYYSHGNVKSITTYQGDSRNGLEYLFYENGDFWEERNYSMNKKDGLWTGWYENGQKKYENHWDNDVANGQFSEWYENGQKKIDASFIDGKKDGLWTVWPENGQKSELLYKDGNLIK
tara:strand:+ start:648 stop:2024 length:1377 start_codon:yes stop_codon:yes gene_type:complete